MMGGSPRQSVMANTQGGSPSAVGFSLRTVVIKEVHPESNVCLASDVQTNESFQLGLNKRGSSSVWPQAGDGWLIDRSMGHWALVSKITSTSPPSVTGNSAAMDPDLLNVIGVLDSMGIITDATEPIAPTTPTPGVWHTPVMQNSWVVGHKVDTVHNPGVRYQLTSDNRLAFSGWLNSGTSTNFTVMFTLPTGFIPAWDHTLNGYRQDNNSSTASGSLMGIKVLGLTEGVSAGQVQIISGLSSSTAGMNIQILGSLPMD